MLKKPYAVTCLILLSSCFLIASAFADGDFSKLSFNLQDGQKDFSRTSLRLKNGQKDFSTLSFNLND